MGTAVGDTVGPEKVENKMIGDQQVATAWGVSIKFITFVENLNRELC